MGKNTVKIKLKNNNEGKKPWPGSSVGSSASLTHQGCRFDPRSGHIQESANEGSNMWYSKSVFLSPFLPLSFKSINKNFKKQWEEGCYVLGIQSKGLSGRRERRQASNRGSWRQAGSWGSPGLFLPERRSNLGWGDSSL